MISVIQNQDLYEIRFKYDPNIVNLVKLVPGRRWNPDGKFWTIPRDKLGFLIMQLKDTQYEQLLQIHSNEHINENATLDPTTHIPNIDISKVPFYIEPGKKPFNHQLDFMKYAIDKENRGYMSGFILGDDPGLGKTASALNLAIYNKRRYKFKHCLVICCINSSKYNWLDDIHKHLQGIEDGYILGTRRLKRDGSLRYSTGNKERLEDLQSGHMYGDKKAPKLPYFIITNIEAIRAKSGKTFPIADEIIRLVNSGEISMIAIDEVHKNTSPTSLQGKQLLRIKKYTGHKVEWIPVTGTPITKNPTDAFLSLKLIDAHNFSSYYTWCKEFCIYGGFGGHEIIGYKNVPRIKAMLQGNMIRRLKKDVLDLPEKMFYTEYIENTTYQKKLEERFTEELLNERSEVLASLNPLVKFLKLRQVNGSPELVDRDCAIDSHYIKKNAKLARLLELLEEIQDRHEKVIVFSNWVEPLRTLYKFISKRWKTCVFTGTMKDSDREKHKQVFINNPEYNIMLATIGSMGVSHSFPGVANEIFYDTPWNYVDRLQAEDRIHGIGRGSTTSNYYTLLSKDTVDERVWRIMYDKKDVASYIVDGKLDIRNNPDLFMKILGR